METVRSSDGTTIALERWGGGPAIVVVGGALSDRTAVAELAPLLAPRFTVVAYDRRGRGDSGDTPPYAVEREIEDLRAVVDAAGGSAFVLGHSSGAALALEAAVGGVPIAKLALYEPPFIVDDSRPPVPSDYLSHLDELVAAGRRGDAVEYFMTVGVLAPPEVVAQMRGSPMWPALEAVAHTIAYDGAVMGGHMAGRPLPSDRWTSVTVPTLVMDGGASPEWARNAVGALVEVLPNAERRTLEGQTHGAAPDVLAPVLVGFFSAGPPA
jgi:pimeloyl-ACP methyl ester carboxylesterase